MAAVLSEELLWRWYLITHALREIAESQLPRKSTCGGEIVPAYEPRPPKSEWFTSIEEKLAQVHQDNVPGSWANLSIYRIPRYLKHGKDKAWVPQIVSLGPYHHDDEHLRHMEQHKWRCLHRILERSRQDIGLYLKSVKKVERRARACYEGRISMSRNEFVKMMVLDGCFVIEMFRGFDEGFKNLGYLPNDPVFSMRESILQIQRDMIMLENQIPLFILERLLSLQSNEPNQKERVANLAIRFFHSLAPGYYSPRDDKKRLKFDPLYDHGKVHCLEVFWRKVVHLRPKLPKTEQWSHRQELSTYYCLSDLREAGIQIMGATSWDCWGDISFKYGILWIPSLEIHEGTRLLFLNLIAFEQSHFNCSHYVTSYVIFMHDLIKSSKDVLYLRERGVIKHRLGSDAEVADLFHQLCQETAFDIKDNYLYYVRHKVMVRHVGILVFKKPWRAYLAQKWNAWRATLENKYFDNPWSIISFIAAVFLLVLTFLQALYTVYGYYKPRS